MFQSPLDFFKNKLLAIDETITSREKRKKERKKKEKIKRQKVIKKGGKKVICVSVYVADTAAETLRQLLYSFCSSSHHLVLASFFNYYYFVLPQRGLFVFSCI